MKTHVAAATAKREREGEGEGGVASHWPIKEEEQELSVQKRELTRRGVRVSARIYFRRVEFLSIAVVIESERGCGRGENETRARFRAEFSPGGEKAGASREGGKMENMYKKGGHDVTAGVHPKR